MTSPRRLTLLCAGLLAALAAAGPAMAQAGAGAAGAAGAAPVPGPAETNAPPAAVDEQPTQPYGCPFKNQKLQLLV